MTIRQSRARDFHILTRNVAKMRPRMLLFIAQTSVTEAEKWRWNRAEEGSLDQGYFLIEDAIENFVELGFVGQQGM